MMQLTRVIGVFKEMKQVTEGMTALRTVSTLMKSFDGSAASIQAVASALSGLKMETATAVLGMTNLTQAQLELVLQAAGVDVAMASETAATIASGTAASGASVGFRALGASILSAAKAVLVFLATNPVGWLITAGVALFAWTKHVENQNKAMREASQAADEYADSTKEAYEKEVENTKSLDDLIDKYKELKRQYEAGGETDSGLRQQILDVQSQITDMVGSQAENLDLVNGKLDDELGKLSDIAKEQAKQEKEAANTAYKAAVDASEKAVSLGIKGANIGFNKKEIYDYVGKITKAERDAFYDSGYNTLFENWGNGKYGLNFDSDIAKGFADVFDFDISTAQGRVDTISAMMETLEKAMPDTYSNSDLYSGLQVAKQHYQEYVDAVQDGAESLIDATVKQQYYSDSLDKSAVKDGKTLEAYRQSWIDLVSNDGMIKQRISDGAISKEDIEQQVDYYISTLGEFSEYYLDWLNKFDEETVARNDRVKEAFNLTQEADELTSWYESLPEGDKELVYDIVVNNTSEERQKTIDALAKMSEGGSVDLNLRPTVDTSVLKRAGWKDAGEGAATVFTSTFANEAADYNEDGGIAMNFTPIIADENGNFVGVLSPDELKSYAERVISDYERTGILEDEKGLKIGATFEGKDAIANASAVAETIHDAQAKIYTTPEAKDMGVESYSDALEAVKEDTLNAATIVTNAWKGTLEDFDTLWGDDSQFKDGVDNYTEQLDTLKEAIDKFSSGELDTSDIVSLRKQFKDLSQYSNKDLDKGLKKVYKDLLGLGDVTGDDTGLMGLFNDQIEELEKRSPDTADALRTIRDEYQNLYDLDAVEVADPLQNVKQSLANTKELATALSEVASNGYLSEESINKLIKTNSGYKGALQQTAAGMVLDTQEANKLAKAQSELNLEIVEANKTAAELSYKKNYEEMVELAGGAENLKKILDSGVGDARIFELNQLNTDLSDDISEWESLASEIRGTISLLQQYQDAQKTSNLGDAYEQVKSGLKGADELYEQGWLGRDDFTSFAKLLAKNGASEAEAVEQYEANRERFKRYLETDTAEEGILNFWKDATELTNEAGEAFLTYDQEADKFEFNIDSMNEFADAMGVNTEMAEYFLLALKDLGYLDIDLSMIGDSFKESVETMDLNSETAVSDMEHLIERMGDLESKGVDCSESLPSIASALSQLQEAGVNIDPLISKLEELGYHLEFDEETKEFKFIADTSEVDSAESEIEGTELEETVNVDANTDEASAAIDEITQDETKTVTAEVVGSGGEETSTDTSSSQDVTVNVTQNPDPLTINVDDATVTVNPDQESYTVTIDDATVTVSPDQDSYEVVIDDAIVTVNPDKESYDVTIDDTTVTVTPDKDSYTVTIDDAEVAVVPDQESYDVVINGQTVTVTPDQDGYDVTINGQTVTVTPDQESYDVTINGQTVTVTPDQDSYDVTINGQTVTITPDKESYDVTVNGQTVTITPDKESYDVTVNDQTFNVTPSTDTIDITISPSGDISTTLQEMQATADANPITVAVNTKGGGFMGEDYDTPEGEVTPEEPESESTQVSATAVIEDVDTSQVDDGTSVDVDANIKKAETPETLPDPVEMEGEISDIEVSETEVDPIEIEANNEQAEETISETEADLSNLDGKETQPEIDADNSGAETEISETEADLSSLDAKTVSPDISADDQASGTISSVSSALDNLNGKTATTYVTTVHKSEGGNTTGGSGTDFADGTVNAFSRGTNVAIGTNQTALLNELGTEAIARDGRFYTIPGGAQFVNLKKGDIVFNHKQTEELQKYGRVTSGGGHGKLALSRGTVNAFYDSSATGTSSRVGKKPTTSSSSSGGSGSSGGNSGSGSNNSGNNNSNSDSDTKSKQSEFQKWFSGLFDWAEVRIKRLHRLTEKWTDKAEKAVRYSYNAVSSDSKISKQYDNQTKYTLKAITATDNEITGQQKAQKTYAKELKKIKKKSGLSKKTIQKIVNQTKNGNFSIESFNSDSEKDKKTQEAIKAYQTYYEKVLSCKDAVVDLKESQLDLYTQLYNIPIDKANAKLEKYEKTLSRIQSISSAVAGGTSAYLNQSVSDAQIGVEKANGGVTSATQAQNSAQTKVNKLQNQIRKTKNKKKKKQLKQQLKTAKADLKNAKAETAAAKVAQKSAQQRLAEANSIRDRYANEPDYAYQNYLLDQQTATMSKENQAAQEAVRTASANLSTAQSKKTTANNNVSKKASSILSKYSKNLSKAQKDALKSGSTVSTNGIKDKKTLNAIKAYNALVKTANSATTGLTAAEEALSDANQLAIETQAEYTQAIQENAKAKFDNVRQSFENQQNLMNATLQKTQAQQSMYAQTGISQIGQAQRDILNSELNQNMALLSNQQAELTALQKAYSENQANMSEADRLAAQAEMENLQGTIFTTTGAISDLRDEISNIEITRLSIDLGKLKTTAEKLQDEIDFNNTKGIRTTANDYQKLIDNSRNQLSILEQENVEYLKQQKYYEVNSQKYQELQEKIDDNNDAIRDARKSQEEWNNSIANLPYETVEHYLELLDAVAENRKSALDLKSDKGIDLTESDYFNQMQDNTDKIEQYTKERAQAFADYQKAMASSEGVYGGKTIEEWKAEYLGFDTQINNLLSDNEELKDSLRDDVYWRDLERAHEASQRLQTVLSGIADLISDDMIYDKNGLLTNWGNARIASLIKQYETIRDEMSTYSKDVDNLNKLYKDGYYTELEYEEKLGEIQQTLLDSASSMKQYMDTIIDMYKEMAQSELDNLNKLIDKRNKALQAKKDYYDFDKTLKNKNSELQSLKAQRDALEGIAGAEAKAKRAKLDADIEEAQDELDEILMEHQFELSSEALSDLKDTLQEAFDERWEGIHQDFNAIQQILMSANNLVSSSATTIASQLDELLHFYGINGASGIASSVITGYSSGTKRVTKDEVARIGEKGDEIYSKNGQLYTTFESGDFVIPNRFSSNLYDWGSFSPNEYYNKVMSGMKPVGDTNNSVVNNNQHYDSLVTIEGDVTREVFPGVERMCKEAYRYMVREATIDAKHAGIKVR